MERLVAVGLGHRDVVLEPAGDRLVHLVDDAERRIAVLDRVHDDADGEQVIDLVQGLALVHHLFVDAEEVLDSAVDLGLDPGLLDVLPHLLGNLLHELLALRLSLRDLVHEVVVDVGL